MVRGCLGYSFICFVFSMCAFSPFDPWLLPHAGRLICLLWIFPFSCWLGGGILSGAHFGRSRDILEPVFRQVGFSSCWWQMPFWRAYASVAVVVARMLQASSTYGKGFRACLWSLLVLTWHILVSLGCWSSALVSRYLRRSS